MEALIMSCGTGGGHNAAARALQESLEAGGHKAVLLNPYDLVSNKLSHVIDSTYIKMAQKTPRMFGWVYRAGDAYRRLPIVSPVYGLNKLMGSSMKEYLAAHHFDVIFYTHVYPGEILAGLKHDGTVLPKTIFIATDYTCIPFTEETDSDYYIIPSHDLKSEYVSFGISEEKLIPIGIPVRRVFREEQDRQTILRRLGLTADKRYILLAGGSMGSGLLLKAVNLLLDYYRGNRNYHLIVLCGNNQKLYDTLCAKHKGRGITPLMSTDKPDLYLKICDMYISKPGGLSSTEAAVSETPLIHISPIPGCESRNMAYFRSHGMCCSVGNRLERLIPAVESLEHRPRREMMKSSQRKAVNKYAADDICRFAEGLTKT